MIDKMVLDNIEPFNDVFYENCFYNSLFPVIIHFKKKIEPILASNLTIYKKNSQGIFDVEFIYIKTPEQIADEVGLKYKTSLICENVINDITQAIISHKLIILWVDCYYIPIRADTYQKCHLPHTLLFYGFNNIDGLFDILEHRHSDSFKFEKRKIRYHDVVNSYKGFIDNYLDIKNKGKTFFEFYNDNVVSENGYSQCTYSYIENYAKYKREIIHGLELLSEFKEYIKEAILDELQLKENGMEILSILNKIVNAKRVESYNIGRLFQSEKEIVNLSEQIVNEWDAFRKVLAKYLYTFNYREDTFNNFVNRIENAYQLECSLNESMFCRS